MNQQDSSTAQCQKYRIVVQKCKNTIAIPYFQLSQLYF